MDGSDEPDIFRGDPSYVDPTRPPTPHEDGDDRQDLVDQEVTARDTEDLLQQGLVQRLLPPAEARRFLDGLDALDGHVPETYRRLIVERIYETLQPLDP